jgi:hypothetical protein
MARHQFLQTFAQLSFLKLLLSPSSTFFLLGTQRSVVSSYPFQRHHDYISDQSRVYGVEIIIP